MDVPVLMNTLMEIERALSAHDECAVRNLILQAQDGVLALERENEALALENAGLRRRLDATHHATLPYAAHSPAYPGPALPAPAALPQPFRREALAADPADDRPPRTWRITHFFFT